MVKISRNYVNYVHMLAHNYAMFC